MALSVWISPVLRRCCELALDLPFHGYGDILHSSKCMHWLVVGSGVFASTFEKFSIWFDHFESLLGHDIRISSRVNQCSHPFLDLDHGASFGAFADCMDFQIDTSPAVLGKAKWYSELLIFCHVDFLGNRGGVHSNFHSEWTSGPNFGSGINFNFVLI